MTRLITAFLLLCLGFPTFAPAAITLYWRAEGTALDCTGTPCVGNDYSVGDATASTVNTPAINTTAVKYGTNGIHINASGEYYAFDLAANFVTTDQGAVAFWVQWITFSATGNTWFEARGDTATNNYRGRGASTDELRLLSNNSTPLSSNHDTTDANVTTSAWYFACYAWDDTNNTRRIYLWDASGVAVGSSPWSDTSTNYNAPLELTGASARLRFGESSSTGGTVEYYLDNIFVGNSVSDCTTFYDNRAITSYSSYGGGAAGVPNGLMLLGVGK